MIILPPEERKSSPILKWIFRILMIVVIMGALMMFALNILSGTSDAHRRGLEQALSDIFKTSVTIGTLKEFNIFPLFNIEMQDVRAPYGSSGGEVRAERVVLVFRFFDLLFGRDLIKDLQISNLTMTPDIIGAYGLRIESAGIVPPKAKGDHPAFELKGEYGDLPVKGSLVLEMIGGVQPVYRIVNDIPAHMMFGKLGVSGKFVQNDKGEPSIQSANFVLDGENIASGSFTLLTSQAGSGVLVDFITSHSQGSLKTGYSPKSQLWVFEKLDLSDVISKSPVWVKISNALNEIALASTSLKDPDVSNSVDIQIKSLTGVLSAENIRGSFIYSPDKLIGWWDGQITTSSPKSEGVPATGAIQCGLLELSPKGSVWSTDHGLIFVDPASILASLKIHSTTGQVEWTIDRVASGTQTTFNADLTSFAVLKAELKFPDSHPCLAYIGKVSAP